jgi:hypothetical protein
VIDGTGFVLIDGASREDEAKLTALAETFVRERLRTSELHPDTWGPLVVRDEGQLEARLAAVAGDKYSYRELDDMTELAQRTLQTVPSVSKVTRSGVLDERVYLVYSQERRCSTPGSSGSAR